jgi:hypothetical protein
MKTFINSAFGSRRWTKIGSARWWDAPRMLRRAALLALLVLLMVALVILAGGCASSPAGLAREEAIYGWATNTVGQARQIVPYLPAPASNAVEVGLGIAAALLAAWNAAQHRAIQQLRNGNGANANGSTRAKGQNGGPG